MSVVALALAGTAALSVVLTLLILHLRRPRRLLPGELEVLADPARFHATYFPVIQQAMSHRDFEFLESRAAGRKVRRIHKERQRVSLLYLSDLRTDFFRLMRLARIVAVLSPESKVSRESQRIWLGVRFACLYRIVETGLSIGLLLMPQFYALSQMVSAFAFRMEAAMNELGERAAVALELASTLDRRGLDAA